MSRFLLLLALVLGTSTVHAQIVDVPVSGASRLQILNLSDDPTFDLIDVYVDGVRIASALPALEATPYIDMAGTDAVVVVTKPDVGLGDAVSSIAVDASRQRDYQIIFGATDFNAAFDSPTGISVFPAEQPTEGRLSVNYYHDAPQVEPHDVRFGESTVATDVTYGTFSTRVPVRADDAILTVESDGEQFMFEIPAREFAGQSLTLVAVSGNQNLPKVVLLVTEAGTTLRVDGVQAGARAAASLAGSGLDAAIRVVGPAPNPFAGTTALGVDLDAPATVSVEVFDVQGRRVAALAPETLGAGAHRLAVDVTAGPGLYLYRVTAVADGTFVVRTGRMVSMR